LVHSVWIHVVDSKKREQSNML